jgi:hypothetical protein
MVRLRETLALLGKHLAMLLSLHEYCTLAEGCAWSSYSDALSFAWRFGYHTALPVVDYLARIFSSQCTLRLSVPDMSV